MCDSNGQVQHFKARKERAQDCINQLQNICIHPKETLEKKHGSNTGNYDPSCDYYWTEFYCLICEKDWHEEQG